MGDLKLVNFIQTDGNLVSKGKYIELIDKLIYNNELNYVGATFWNLVLSRCADPRMFFLIEEIIRPGIDIQSHDLIVNYCFKNNNGPDYEDLFNKIKELLKRKDKHEDVRILDLLKSKITEPTKISQSVNNSKCNIL